MGQSSSHPHNRKHSIFTYTTTGERFRFLARYFQEGLAANNLCVYVTSESPASAVTAFKKHGLDVAAAQQDGSFRIFSMHETYLPNGEFAMNIMLANVEQFIADAKRLGYAGLYTAGDMSWLYNAPVFWTRAMEYESKINDIQDRHPSFTGLCLYPTSESSVIEQFAAKTHPLHVVEGRMVENDAYVRMTPAS